MKKYMISEILDHFYDEDVKLNNHEKKVIHDIVNCRTEEFGTHKQSCTCCGDEVITYNSCRNRNCPVCQSGKGFKWVKNRIDELLPVQYFHLVFTIPKSLKNIFLFNKTICFKLMFHAVNTSLKKVSFFKHKVQTGAVSILHTWDQKLNFHPHIHCIVAGGGLKNNGKWKALNKYLFPNEMLSALFKGVLLSGLENSHRHLKFSKKNYYLNDSDQFKLLLKESAKKNWIVYSKNHFSNPVTVINYLGKYIHKIAISNKRIIKADDRSVTFLYRDRKDNDRIKQETISGKLFFNRFILHIVPKGFVKVRYSGFMVNRLRKKSYKVITKAILKTGKTLLKKIKKAKDEYALKYIKALSVYQYCKVCGGKLFDIDRASLKIIKLAG